MVGAFLIPLWSNIRAAVRTKLGRCPRCMRLSARAALAGWSIVALVSLVSPNPFVLVPALVVAATFTLLLAAHVVVFTRRWLPALEARQRPAREGAAITRRRFVGNVLIASMGGLFVSLFARVPVALATSCDMRHKQRFLLGTGGENKKDCRRNLGFELIKQCNQFCAGQPGCDPGMPCECDHVEHDEFKSVTETSCQTIVRAFKCRCKKPPKEPPAGPCQPTRQNILFGTGGKTVAECHERLTNAITKECEKFCARQTGCTGDERCRCIAFTRGEITDTQDEDGHFHCQTIVFEYECGCRDKSSKRVEHQQPTGGAVRVEVGALQTSSAVARRRIRSPRGTS